MPDFHQIEKRIGLHSAVFRKPALRANGLGLAPLPDPARSAKVGLVQVPEANDLEGFNGVACGAAWKYSGMSLRSRTHDWSCDE